MKVQEAKSKLKFYLIFTLVFWVALPLLGFIVFQLFDIPDSPALETGVSGFFGVVGFLWLIETFRSFKAIYVIIKSKPKKKNIDIPYKDLEKENGNSDYIKIDKKLFNTILIVLGVIVVFYIGYISGGNPNTSSQTITYNQEDFEWDNTPKSKDEAEEHIFDKWIREKNELSNKPRYIVGEEYDRVKGNELYIVGENTIEYSVGPINKDKFFNDFSNPILIGFEGIRKGDTISKFFYYDFMYKGEV